MINGPFGGHYAPLGAILPLWGPYAFLRGCDLISAISAINKSM